MPALDCVLLEEVEVLVVFVDIVFIDRGGQPTNNKKMSVSVTDATRSMKCLLSFMPCQLFQRFSIVDVNPRVGVALGIIELA